MSVLGVRGAAVHPCVDIGVRIGRWCRCPECIPAEIKANTTLLTFCKGARKWVGIQKVFFRLRESTNLDCEICSPNWVKPHINI